LASLKLVLGDASEAQLRSALAKKRKQFALAEEGGRIPCKELHDISHRIMTCEQNAAKAP